MNKINDFKNQCEKSIYEYINESENLIILQNKNLLKHFNLEYFQKNEENEIINDLKILEDSKKQNVKIQLSGQGGDEIYGNNQEYGFDNLFNPEYFPRKLIEIFPWNNFYHGGNYSYLTKEEHVAGSLGIETRYPLLDREVVQEFLNLAPKHKNKQYKSPLANYLQVNKFPYIEGKKGFHVNKFYSKYLNQINKSKNIDMFNTKNN